MTSLHPAPPLLGRVIFSHRFVLNASSCPSQVTDGVATPLSSWIIQCERQTGHPQHSLSFPTPSSFIGLRFLPPGFSFPGLHLACTTPCPFPGGPCMMCSPTDEGNEAREGSGLISAWQPSSFHPFCLEMLLFSPEDASLGHIIVSSQKI